MAAWATAHRRMQLALWESMALLSYACRGGFQPPKWVVFNGTSAKIRPFTAIYGVYEAERFLMYTATRPLVRRMTLQKTYPVYLCTFDSIHTFVLSFISAFAVLLF